jgi:hypothetical protein
MLHKSRLKMIRSFGSRLWVIPPNPSLAAFISSVRNKSGKLTFSHDNLSRYEGLLGKADTAAIEQTLSALSLFYFQWGTAGGVVHF